MEPEHAATVLVADDDGPMREMLAACLSAAGLEVELASDGAELKSRLGAREIPGVPQGDPRDEHRRDHHRRDDRDAPTLPDVIVSDVRMPGWTGLAALHYLHEHHPGVQVVLITAFGDPRTHERARQLGAAAVFDKPFDLSALREKVLSLVASRTTGRVC